MLLRLGVDFLLMRHGGFQMIRDIGVLGSDMAWNLQIDSSYFDERPELTLMKFSEIEEMAFACSTWAS